MSRSAGRRDLGTGPSDRAVAALRRMPLQVRLVAILLTLLTLALSLTTLATTALMRQDLLARVDSELNSAARPMVNQALRDLIQTRQPRIPTGFALVLMDSDGAVLLDINPTTEQDHPKIPALAVEDPRVRSGDPFTVPSVEGDDTRWRVVAGRLTAGDTAFALAMPLSGLTRTIDRLVAVATLVGLASMALVAGLGFFAIRRAFRPLHHIEEVAGAIAGGDLTRRIEEHPADDEVASLTSSLNLMLERIEGAFTAQAASEERMRQFVADASHELRTPLATVRGYAELHRQGALPDADAVTGAMGRIEGEAARMSGLVDDLLLLARLDQAAELELASVDLTVLAADAVSDARARAPERDISLLGVDGPLGPCVVQGDESRLRQVLTNLVTNAVRHTPAGTAVDVLVGGDDATGVIQVRDHGPGIDPADTPRVFERFYRADPARGRSTGGGNGLGLAIVAAIVAQHRGRVGLATTRGGGATFVVQIPRHRDQPKPSAPSEVPARSQRPST